MAVISTSSGEILTVAHIPSSVKDRWQPGPPAVRLLPDVRLLSLAALLSHWPAFALAVQPPSGRCRYAACLPDTAARFLARNRCAEALGQTDQNKPRGC